MSRAIGWVCASRVRQVLLLVLVCCAIFLPRLGETGLSMSEGHRVIPAWEMLDDARAGDPHWLVPRMFETNYLRKPPGMPWAIAGSSAIFGQTEFAARLPSAIAATLLALSVWYFGTRWFGSPWGMAAGLAQALLPVTWPSARSAEIESLHMLTTGLVALAILDWFIRPPKTKMGLGLRAVMVFLACLAMLLTKGPSGAPFIVGTMIGALLVPALSPMRKWKTGISEHSEPRPSARGWRRIHSRNPRHECRGSGCSMFSGILPILLALGAATTLGKILTHHNLGDTPAVTQGVGSFLWERGKLIQILFISPTILATMLPVSLALLFPWGPDAARERAADTDDIGPGTIARALAFSCLASLVIFEVSGVSNERYGLPLCALLTPLVAYVARGAWDKGSPKDPDSTAFFIANRPRIAHAIFLGSPLAWPAIFLIAAAAYVGVMEPHRRASSGRDAGIALAAHLPDHAEVWADELIEARPEVLLYAVREAARQGRTVRVRWLKPDFMPSEYPLGLLLLLREDDRIDEVARFTAEQRFGTLTEIARGEVHKYTFVLCRAEGQQER